MWEMPVMAGRGGWARVARGERRRARRRRLCERIFMDWAVVVVERGQYTEVCTRFAQEADSQRE
jgi:hypothetical protein